MSTHDLLREQAKRKHALLRDQQARAAALQRQVTSLQEAIKTTTSLERAAFSALAKAECNALCTLITILLPREIRDMIAHHLTTSPAERINREYFRSTLDPTTNLHTYDPTRWKATHYPSHIWSPAYTTPTFHAELVHNYFHTSTFIFPSSDDGLIARFLSTDLMGNGYPPGELVSSIEVHLSAMTYDRTSCIGYMFGCATKPERLVAALKGVEEVKTGARVEVKFATQARDEEQRRSQVRMAWGAVGSVLKEAEVRGVWVRWAVDGVDGDLDDDGGIDGVDAAEEEEKGEIRGSESDGHAEAMREILGVFDGEL